MALIRLKPNYSAPLTFSVKQRRLARRLTRLLASSDADDPAALLNSSSDDARDDDASSVTSPVCTFSHQRCLRAPHSAPQSPAGLIIFSDDPASPDPEEEQYEEVLDSEHEYYRPICSDISD